jgi:xanthine dehydrogenase accessory factor
MLFPETLCVIRGGGDLATGVVHRLHHAGFPVIVLELEQPRVVRRMASVAQAMFSGELRIGSLIARRMTLDDFAATRNSNSIIIPVVADPVGEAITRLHPAVVVDGRMAKAPLDTTMDAAPFVVGLGPGFVAGQHCHAVIETNRGHDLGRVIWRGPAQPDTGRPEAVLGFGVDRVLHAPASGILRARKQIGDMIQYGDTIAVVNDQPILAPFIGVLRGLIYDGLTVTANEKVGDLDPRGQVQACFTISDKALAVGGGVVEAVLAWMQGFTTKTR